MVVLVGVLLLGVRHLMLWLLRERSLVAGARTLWDHVGMLLLGLLTLLLLLTQMLLTLMLLTLMLMLTLMLGAWWSSVLHMRSLLVTAVSVLLLHLCLLCICMCRPGGSSCVNGLRHRLLILVVRGLLLLLWWVAIVALLLRPLIVVHLVLMLLLQLLHVEIHLLRRGVGLLRCSSLT